MIYRPIAVLVFAGTDQPPEFWSALSTNALILLVGGALAVISYAAYRREQERSFQMAALGFVFITFGNLLIVIYQVGVKGSYLLGGLELLRIQTIQGTLVLFGLALLVYSLYRY